MGPVISPGGVWLPIEPADRPAQGELELGGDKDRRSNRQGQRRRHQEQQDPDGDEFHHASEEPEAEQ